MKNIIFKAMTGHEGLVCNSCLANESQSPIDVLYQDTGRCTECRPVKEVTKPKAASILNENGFGLYVNFKMRNLFFSTGHTEIKGRGRTKV